MRAVFMYHSFSPAIHGSHHRSACPSRSSLAPFLTTSALALPRPDADGGHARLARSGTTRPPATAPAFPPKAKAWHVGSATVTATTTTAAATARARGRRLVAARRSEGGIAQAEKARITRRRKQPPPALAPSSHAWGTKTGAQGQSRA
jgi:hypothetical protein